MLGEIRDSETASIAVRAAQTGHLVFSTLHTNNAIGAITRLLDIGIEPFLVSASVLGIVAQRLVRLICTECKESYTPDKEAEEAQYVDPNTVLYRGRGCSNCNYTGYYGQTAIHEILPITKELRDSISRGSSIEQLKKIALQEGLVTMQQDGMKKVLQGYTTIQEIMRLSYEEG